MGESSSYRAKIKKTWYALTNDRHLDRGEVVSEDDVTLYATRGTIGWYYPDDEMFIADDGTEYGLAPESVARIKER